MKLPSLRWHLSSRVHLALGLSALAISAMFVATWLGLVPDADAMTRQNRASLAETIGVTVSSVIDESDPQPLHDILRFVQLRQPELRSIGVRAADGTLLLDLADHAAAWRMPPEGRSTDSAVVVPVWQHGEPWGQVELRFTALRDEGWRGWLQDPSLRLAAFLFLACTPVFAVYLARMLRELDPSRAVPPRVRAAYDTLTEGLLVLDAKGTIVLANRSTGDMLGVDETRLVGRSPGEFEWTDPLGGTVARADQPWAVALSRRDRCRDAQLRVRGAGGRRYALRANCSPLLSDRGGVQAVVVSFQDVTELEERGEALRVAKEQADAANEAKSRFLANMSHEIRTPMNAILGFTEVLRRSGLRQPGEAARHLDVIHSSGRHLLNLINDILDLSKVEAGRLDAERIPTSPHVVAAEVVQTLRERAADKGLALEIEAPAAMPASLMADPSRLRQIMTNLVGNAIKFTERGEVTVRLRMEGSGDEAHYCIDVQDTGIGIAADKLDAVFEPFVQAESSTTRRFGGTGLGLTISRGFSRAMGGDILVHSTPGQGTTFTLRLPAGASAGPMLAPQALLAPVASAIAAPARRWRFPPRRVLVVDDGAENRQLVRVLLEEAGLVVLEADNGQAALERVSAEPPDLVLMDMQMPVMDGQTATRRLRAAGCTLPILALTANAMKGFEHELQDAGFSGYQTKPIDIEALLADLASRLGGEELVDAPSTPAAAIDGTQRPAAVAADRPGPIVSRLVSHAKLGRIVARFVEQLPDKLDEIGRAVEAGDAAAVAALAHWLKGAGGSMGFDALFEPSKMLEASAKADDLAGCANALALLRRLGERIAAGHLRAGVPLETA